MKRPWESVWNWTLIATWAWSSASAWGQAVPENRGPVIPTVQTTASAQTATQPVPTPGPGEPTLTAPQPLNIQLNKESFKSPMALRAATPLEPSLPEATGYRVFAHSNHNRVGASTHPTSPRCKSRRV